jgi:hypothetical protein
MLRIPMVLAALVLGLAVMTSGALADSCQAMAKEKVCAHKGAALCCQDYNSKKVTMVSGEIVEIERVACAKGKSKGVHLTLKIAEETVEVHLGPAWFLDEQEAKFSSGDKIEVMGCRLEQGGKHALIAAKIKKGDGVLVLRDKEGWPVWSAWRMGASL